MHFDEGDVYEAMTEDGQRYTITVGARNEDGTVQVQSSLDAEPVNVNPEQVGGAILADMDRARASQGEAEQGEIDGQAEMPSADVDTAQSNVPVYQQSDVVEARMPGGTVRGEIFEVSEEAGMPVYSVQWESPVQGVMVGRYSGEELSALQPAAEPEIGIELVMPTDEEVAAVTAERLRREEAEAANGNNLIPEDLRRVLSSEEIEALMDAMEENAVEPENVPYTREEWDARFSSPIETPAGKVRMGEHQFGKLHPDGNEQRQDRRGWIGHIYATLTSPSIIVEQPSPETGAEREYKYVFVKSFVNADGDAVTFFASVTVKKNDMEVVITNHFKKYKDVKNLLKKGKLCFSSVSPSGMQTEPNRSTASATTSEADINAGASASKGTTQSVSVQENEQKSLQPLPTRTTKKGTEVLYHEVPVARTLEELYDGTLTQPEVDAFVTANVKESRKAAERIESTPPKMGTDLAAYKQAKAEWQGKVDEARRKADYWLEVQAEVQKITGRQNESASRSIESASRSIESASRFTEMPTSMSEAQDGAEYAAMAFAGKMALRITPESFRGETGLGSAEQRQLTGVIATPENGGVTIEQAAEWLYAAQENDGVSFYADETEARDAIIDVLSQGNPKGYVARSRKEAAKRDSQAEAADKEAWAQQHFHMSFEEYQAMEEQAIPAIIEQYRGFDEATYYANLANDYEQQNERRNETRQNSATESAGIGRSGELLQGEQPASTGGTRHIGDGQQGRAAASDVQGGVSAEDAPGTPGGGRSENNRNLAERQGDLGTSIKTSATETDEDGSPFVLSSSGTTTFGEIKAETGLTPAPIKLSLGNSKYGLIHLERRHGEQIRNAGFKSVEEFVEYVCKNYKRIKQGENSVGEENGTYLLQIEDAHNNTLYIELSTDGRYWGVNSGGVFRKGYGNNKKEVWSASEEQNKQSVADSTLREEENPDIPTTPNGDVPTTSTGKSTEEVSNLQGNGQESAADAEDAPVKAETPTISQESEQVSDQDNAPYTIAPAQYTTKKGKVLDMHLVKFAGTLTKEQQRAAKELAKAEKGWYDREQGGFMMRSEESAKQLADLLDIEKSNDALNNIESAIDETGSTEKAVDEDDDTLYRSDDTDTLSDVNERFNNQLDTFSEENADSIVFDLGTPSDVLQAAGVVGKPMKLYGSKVAKKMRRHGFSVSELRDLPRAIANPIAVFNNYNEKGNRSILTELRTEQGNFLVTLSIGKGQDVDFNIVSSVFGKGDNNIINWLNNGYATYINKEKALNYLHLATPIVAASDNQELVSATKIVESFENPQVSEVKNDEDIRYRFQNGMSQDELFDALNEHAEYYNAGPSNLIAALEDYFGGELVSASSGARNAIEISGLVPVPGGKYSGVEEEYHHIEFRNSNGETFVESVPFVRPEDVAERGIKFREGEGMHTDDALSMENDPVAKMLGKPRFTRKQRREFAERERQRMVARVEHLAKKLHLDNVEVVTDASTLTSSNQLPLSQSSKLVGIRSIAELEGKKQRAKGFYSKSTGKITIVIPNHKSVFDVEQTLLHEAVAHYGLRQLFGEHFDTFLDNVYQSADRPIRERINSLASKNGWDFRTGTEEYLASLAEQTNFEDRDAGWWSEIKRWFLDMLHKIGFEGFTGVTLTDNELRYILWRSYENLAEPGRYRSILGEVSDVAKQYELGVGNYAVSDERAYVAAEDQADNIEAVNARFNAELEDFKKKTHVGLMHLGSPGAILRASGVNANSITLSPSVLHQHLKKHKLSADNIKDLPKALQAPILVYKHGLKHPNIVVVTEMEVRDGKISVSLRLDNDGNVVEVNNVRSVHSKNATKELERLSLLPLDALKNNLRWVDKEKVSDWLGLPYMGERQDVNPKLFSAANIVSNFENPQVPGVKNDEEEVLFRSKHEEAREDWATRTANIQAAVDHYERMTASTGKKWFVTALAKTLSLNAGTRRAARNDLAEAYFDYTRSLEQLIKGLEKAYGKKVKGFENVWWAMNRKSSMDAREMDRVRFKYVDPLSDALGNLLRHAKELRGEKMTDTDVETYLMALHGLERNLHMAKRYAREAMIKEVTDGLALKEREAAINNVDATIAAREANGEEWWSEYRKDYSSFTEMFGVSIIAA